MAQVIKMKKGMRATRNFYLDILQAGFFVLALFPDVTGYSIHEGLGYVLGGILLIHLFLHWKWLINVTKRFFGKMPLKTRISYLLTGLLVGTFGIIGITGVLMGEQLGLGLGSDFIEEIHEFFANFSIMIVIAHVLLQGKWIITTFQRKILGIKPSRQNLNPAPKPAQINNTKVQDAQI